MSQPNTKKEMQIITIVDIQDIYGCTYRTAQRRLREARQVLGKNPNVNGQKGGDPVTREQFYHAHKLNPPEKK